MLRLKTSQLWTWDALLPEELTRLPDELARVDQWLNDERFFEPYLKRFNKHVGRPTVPVDTFHRLMYLRFRRQLSYEGLVQAVSDSIVWRRFCHIPLQSRVPDSTTLVKLVKKYGPDLLDELNRQLVDKAREKRIIHGRKLRIDTTVVESNIDYPTDADLLSDGVKSITRMVKKLKKTGVVVARKFQDHTREVKKRILSIAKVLQRRSGENRTEVERITGEILKIAKRVLTGAKAVIYEATERAGEIAGHAVERTLDKIRHVAERTERVVKQTEQVLSGDRHVVDRIVSLADPDARPIKKGRLKAPTEFGYKVLIQETEKHIVTDYEVFKGNPSDKSLLAPAVEKHKRAFGHVPNSLAADRGFSAPAKEQWLQEQGVKHVAIPRPGKITAERKAVQSERWFKKAQRWRAGIEGTISLLKRRHRMKRSLMLGHDGARTWVACSVMAYNLCTLATM